MTKKTRWQPIETAPKDGTEIWAFCMGEQVRMKFISGDGYALWSYADDTLSEICPDPEPPSHWMPLPDPPTRAHRTPNGQMPPPPEELA